MQYIILIGDEGLTLDSVKNIRHYDARCGVDGNRHYVDYGQDHIFYDFVADISDQYTRKERRKIPFKKPNFIMMVYKSIDRVKDVMKQEDFPRGIYVDDDIDTIQPIEDFIKSLDDGTSPLIR